ncbi:hypothetical protein [Escherichia coli]|uniref:hypothetical protein n=1 Tax=Escherichia coli TaxID=562 RepID=UPI00112F1153|nr:hypothetical protein [Escherichia coli]
MINVPSFTKYENLAIDMNAILHDFPSKPCFPYSEQEFDCDPEDHDSDNYLRPSDYNSFIHTPRVFQSRYGAERHPQRSRQGRDIGPQRRALLALFSQEHLCRE